MLDKPKWIAVGAAVVLALGVYLLWPRSHCRSAKSNYDLIVRECPDGTPRQVVHLRGEALKRGGPGWVEVAATAVYTIGTSDATLQARIERFAVELELIDAAGQVTPLTINDKWQLQFGQARARLVLPEVADGDYSLRARVSSKVGESSVDLPLPLYAPARIHLLTDRPLYEPGNEVKFRALVVRARDLSPIDDRPGTWIVTDPEGEVLLEEKAPAGPWGVVAGSFPLDRQATVGQWSVTWRSGDDESNAPFTVEPFTLPRFRVEAAPDRPFYQPGQTPTISGLVVYSSGAPVVGAELAITWNTFGDWPPPTEWREGGLPTRAETDGSGRFSLTLPLIPPDLRERVTLAAQIAASDAAGDRVTGMTTLLLSRDAIAVDAVTELGGGLVESANNRVYLRVTTADGRPLPGAKLVVKRAWSPSDQGIEAEADTDSVARIQIDPGPPVNVVIPPMPIRRPPGASPGQLVSQTRAAELVSNGAAPLADRVAMDRWLAPLEACAKWVVDGEQQAGAVVR
ncbi:MAG: MG2 domain-containing protein, partial [Myxococcota bacterium]